MNQLSSVLGIVEEGREGQGRHSGSGVPPLEGVDDKKCGDLRKGRFPSGGTPLPLSLRTFLLCLLATLLAGCDPADLIHWAPDGRHAIVQGADGEYLIDSEGKILGKTTGAQIWMPDSRHAVGVRSTDAHSWEEYAALLGKERADAVASGAEQLLPIIRAYKGDWDKFDQDETVQQWTSSHKDAEGSATVLYLAEKHADVIAPALEAWKKSGEKSTTASIYTLGIRSVLPGEDPDEHVLLRSADSISAVTPSPDGTAIAFVMSSPNGPSLRVIVAGGGDVLTVADGPTQAAWMPDSKQLVFARPNSAGKDQDATLGSITRAQIRGDNGELLLKSTEDLAGILFAQNRSSVACLPDGRILFTTFAIQLPALDKDMPKTATLFLLQPGESSSIMHLLSPQMEKLLPDRADAFVLSPDAKHIAVPGENGEVAVISLEKGEVTSLQGKAWDLSETKNFHNQTRPLPLIPSWRGPDELCYVAAQPDKNGEPSRGELVLQKLGATPRIISHSWSDAMTDAFLPRPKAPEPKADGSAN